MEIVNKIVQMNKKAITALIVFSIIAALVVSAISAGASNTSVEDVQTDTVVEFGNVKASDKAVASFKVVSNHRTVSKAKIKKAKQAGKCKTISGQKAIRMGVMTQGYMGSGTGYAYENRTTTMCDTNGDGKFDVRAQCGNRLIVRQPRPQEAKATIWVNNLGKAKAKIKVLTKVVVSAKCDTENTSATSFAKASARATVFVKLKNLVKANGKVDGEGLAKIKTKVVTRAQAKAKAKAEAEASVRCEEGRIITEKPELPEKPEKEVTTLKGAEQVEALPETGPGAVVATFVGISSLSGLLYRFVTRRYGADL